MKLLISLLLFSSIALGDCHIKVPLFSLAGPSTVMLKELGLLKDKNLKGISTFNPIEKSAYSGPRIGGGLFLSRQEDKTFQGAEVIYDQGRELDRYFSKRKFISVPIETAGLTPREVSEKTLGILESKLVGCKEKLKSLKNKISNLSKLSWKGKKKIVFFLGPISSTQRFPEMAIGQDGFVKDFKKREMIETYPSDLLYIRWSQKIMDQLPVDFIFIGVSESPDQVTKKMIRMNSRHININFPGALTPGFSQLELMGFLVEKLN